jgi:hypothetical protein
VDASPPVGPLTILAVDDEPNIRKTLSYCLKAERHAVVAVGNAADAVAFISVRDQQADQRFWIFFHERKDDRFAVFSPDHFKGWIILMMIVGRVGVLTFAYIIVGSGPTNGVEYAEENLMIG